MTEQLARQIYVALLMVATLGGMAVVFFLYERLRDRRVKERQVYRDAEMRGNRGRTRASQTS